MEEVKEIKESSSVEKKNKSDFVEVGSLMEVKGKPVNTESTTESYFDGKLLELMAYNYFYIFITVFTVGIGRAWGECLLNKYIYSHTVVSGKRLKFEGFGDELFAKRFRWSFFRLITLEYILFGFLLDIKSGKFLNYISKMRS